MREQEGVYIEEIKMVCFLYFTFLKCTFNKRKISLSLPPAAIPALLPGAGPAPNPRKYAGADHAPHRAVLRRCRNLAHYPGGSYLQQQFREPDILHNAVVVLLPLVRRQPGYAPHQFDLCLFVKHHQVTDLGELELYRVKDFIRQKVDVAPLMHALQQIAGVDTTQVLESIKRQIKFLQRPENLDLPVAPAQMINQHG